MKERLSTEESAEEAVTLSLGQQVHLRLTRAEFEEMTAGLVQRALGPTRKALTVKMNVDTFYTKDLFKCGIASRA